MNLSVVNVTDPSEIAAVLNSADGEDIILNTIQRNPDRVNAAIAR